MRDVPRCQPGVGTLVKRSHAYAITLCVALQLIIACVAFKDGRGLAEAVDLCSEWSSTLVRDTGISDPGETSRTPWTF